jgi:GGDEF domain-containing protein
MAGEIHHDQQSGMPAAAAQRAMLFGIALDAIDEGVVILDEGTTVVGWNAAAAAITGFAPESLIGRICPKDLYTVDPSHAEQANDSAKRAILVHLRHQGGHTLPAMLRRIPLHDAIGSRLGTLFRFHPTEERDTLQHGELGEGIGLERTQADLEDRLAEAWRDWVNHQQPFGLLWIMVDQAAMLRKTHGRDACEAMLAIVERSLLHGLRPTETLGRWGDNEFLVLAHERTPEMLEAHARHLAGLTRAADFRWWGDRIALTISIGAVQAAQGESLPGLLVHGKSAMATSMAADGDHVASYVNTQARGR